MALGGEVASQARTEAVSIRLCFGAMIPILSPSKNPGTRRCIRLWLMTSSFIGLHRASSRFIVLSSSLPVPPSTPFRAMDPEVVTVGHFIRFLNDYFPLELSLRRALYIIHAIFGCAILLLYLQNQRREGPGGLAWQTTIDLNGFRIPSGPKR